VFGCGVGYNASMRNVDRIRILIAREAARLMYEEGVREYRDAKRKAAKRFGPGKALSLGSHLPTNAEIHAELQGIVSVREEKMLPERLFRLRFAALSYMELLEPFRPHLVGSVLAGTVTERSDVDLHLFASSVEEVEEYLEKRSIPFDMEVVEIRRGGEFLEYPHVYLDDEGIVIECTVYPDEDINRIPRSSITGKPMERACLKKLRKILGEMVTTKPDSDDAE